uniref:Uncharacterized protein n=1 Tax=Tanacetum cinerariifolium TaxID=118510 RepID=A0A6L2NS60_TANCI|nr:hypothetical protein [Tanacetum cinerariifolium]
MRGRGAVVIDWQGRRNGLVLLCKKGAHVKVGTSGCVSQPDCNKLNSLPESIAFCKALNPLVVPPMEIVMKGTEAIKGFMIKWRLASIAAEEHKRMLEVNDQNQHGWLAWGTNMLNSYLGEEDEDIMYGQSRLGWTTYEYNTNFLIKSYRLGLQ